MGFLRQEYWSELPFPSPGDLPDPGIKPMFPASADGFITTETPRKPNHWIFSKSISVVLLRLTAAQTMYVKVKVSQSCLTLCDPMNLYSPWNSPGQDTGVGSLSLLQGIFPIQGLNPGLPHGRQIFHQLSHKGSPRLCMCSVVQ